MKSRKEKWKNEQETEAKKDEKMVRTKKLIVGKERRKDKKKT